MTDLINIEKLKIYNSYGGDIDGIYRNNRQAEKAVFGKSLDKTWTFISTKIQDIELISKRLTSYDFAKKTLTELYETTDAETFKIFTDKIFFYADFQKVRKILETIKDWTTDKSDIVLAGYDKRNEFLIDLNKNIERIKFCDFETLDKLNLEFAPTSTYQEISLSNGWADEYIKLAEQFDKLYEKIKSLKSTDFKKEWWKY